MPPVMLTCDNGPLRVTAPASLAHAPAAARAVSSGTTPPLKGTLLLLDMPHNEKEYPT